MGDAGALSFGGSKLLTSGRGGCVLTSDATLAQRIRLYDHRGNEAYPLSEMQAALLLPQLHQLDAGNRQRADAVKRLIDGWPESSGVRPKRPADVDAGVFYKVPFQVVSDELDRGCLIDRWQAQGVPIAAAFPALHRIHAKRRFRLVADVPSADELHTKLLTLHHPILLQATSVLDMLRDMLTVCR